MGRFTVMVTFSLMTGISFDNEAPNVYEPIGSLYHDNEFHGNKIIYAFNSLSNIRDILIP